MDELLSESRLGALDTQRAGLAGVVTDLVYEGKELYSQCKW